MSFREKSLWATLISLVVVTLVYLPLYFGHAGILGEAAAAGWGARVPMYFAFGTAVALLVVLLIVAHAVIAIRNVGEANDAEDERDRLIGLRGERIGGLVLGAGVLLIATVAAFDVTDTFVIAHLLLALMVLSEVASHTVQLYHHRQGV